MPKIYRYLPGTLIFLLSAIFKSTEIAFLERDGQHPFLMADNLEGNFAMALSVNGLRSGRVILN